MRFITLLTLLVACLSVASAAPTAFASVFQSRITDYLDRSYEEGISGSGYNGVASWLKYMENLDVGEHLHTVSSAKKALKKRYNKTFAFEPLIAVRHQNNHINSKVAEDIKDEVLAAEYLLRRTQKDVNSDVLLFPTGFIPTYNVTHITIQAIFKYPAKTYQMSLDTLTSTSSHKEDTMENLKGLLNNVIRSDVSNIKVRPEYIFADRHDPEVTPFGYSLKLHMRVMPSTDDIDGVSYTFLYGLARFLKFSPTSLYSIEQRAQIPIGAFDAGMFLTATYLYDNVVAGVTSPSEATSHSIWRYLQSRFIPAAFQTSRESYMKKLVRDGQATLSNNPAGSFDAVYGYFGNPRTGEGIDVVSSKTVLIHDYEVDNVSDLLMKVAQLKYFNFENILFPTFITSTSISRSKVKARAYMNTGSHAYFNELPKDEHPSNIDHLKSILSTSLKHGLLITDFTLAYNPEKSKYVIVPDVLKTFIVARKDTTERYKKYLTAALKKVDFYKQDLINNLALDSEAYSEDEELATRLDFVSFFN